MTPRDHAEKIVERFLSTPEGFAPDDKQALIAAIEQGMNEVLDEAGDRLDAIRTSYRNLESAAKVRRNKTAAIMCANVSKEAADTVRAMKSPDTPRNTITDNQKD